MLPKFVDSLIVPLVKNKSGHLSDVNNYRAIVLSKAKSKMFECTLLEYVISNDNVDMCQFGFKEGLFTLTCTNVLKTIVEN